MKTKRKIPKTFIFFLIASCFIWLLITFSKEYTTTISYPVVYKNIPQDRLLQSTPLQSINITIKATGYKILSSQFISKKIVLEASKLKRSNTSKFYFLLKNQFSKIERQLPPNIEIKDIEKDTIFLDLGILASKKVALNPNVNIKYHIGYDLLNPIKVVPDSVIISGSEAQIDKINQLELSDLVLEDVKDDFSRKVQIVKPENIDNLKVKITEATISGNVEKFTEGKIKIPFTIKNLPQNVNLTSLTEKVEVIFVVDLSNFAKVSKDYFTVECDYKVSKNNGLSYLIPKLTSQPEFIKSYKIIPSKIDFLIQK